MHLFNFSGKFLFKQNTENIQTIVYKYVESRLKNVVPFVLIIFLMFSSSLVKAQNTSFPKDTLIKAAREIIMASPYCAFVTIDSKGQPQIRTMNPFPLGNEIVIWFATNRKSRKVDEIKNNPKVCVYYADHNKAKGYVSINGTAEIIDNKELLIKMKRAYWEGIPDWQNKFVLIKITPKTMDVINYERGISGDSETSRSPVVEF
jgi:general stress protein 26